MAENDARTRPAADGGRLVVIQSVSLDIRELCPIQERGIFGDCHFRMLTFEGGQILPAHLHNFVHATLVAEGSVRVRFSASADGTIPAHEEIYTAPAVFEVPARVGHEISAFGGPARCYCIFPVRDMKGQIPAEVTDVHRKDRFWHERLGGGDAG